MLVKNKNKCVFDSYYTYNKYIVANVNGSMISAECNGHKITRHIPFFKKVNNELECKDDDFDLSILKSSEVETDNEIHVKDHVDN